ncbi:hypothetical protein [Novosphingobium olei]|nr:hypothetical protein [Novosphingobium olei]
MSTGLRRSLANLACRTLQATLPPSLQSWGWAIRYETAGISDDTTALLFALNSLCGLFPRVIAAQVFHPVAALFGGAAMRSPRALGILCATGAVLLGLVYMAAAGAPTRYLWVNAAALVIGLTMLAVLGRAVTAERCSAEAAIIAMAGALLATALLGADVEGAVRWVYIGGLSVQPSLVLLPMMLALFARTRSTPATLGIIAAALAMALQPDRSMAAMLALYLATLAAIRRDPYVLTALAASVIGFALTLVRADRLPAVPYVDQILYSSFDVHAVAGLAVLSGSALLLVPAIAGWRRDPDNRATYSAFGAIWLVVILAAALGNYPTPVVGYGGSAIIGYALSLLALPKRAGARAGGAAWARDPADGTASDRHLLIALA